MVLRTLDEQLQPAHTALVIVDMQNDFCAEGGYLQRVRAGGAGQHLIDARENVAIAERIDVLAGEARRSGAVVAWLRSLYDFKYLADAHIAKRDAEGCCMEGSWGADFFHIRPQEGDLVVDKHTFSGFHDTELHARLQERGVRTLVMTGVATNVCVDSTLRHGFFLGYHIVVPQDCVGSGNETGHAGTLSTVRVNFGSVVASREVMDRFAQPARQPA